jgi:uncharacterized protein
MSVDQILLTGSSGLIGTSLVRALRRDRIATVTLRRRPHQGARTPKQDSPEFWDPYAATPVTRPETLEGITAAVHLSGANLAGRRWTSAYKREIFASRVTPTHALATLLAGMQSKPAVLVCASAIGIYGSRGDELLTEDSVPGTGFLSEVCLAWEKATQPAEEAGIRVVHLRFGVVLAAQGGALGQILPVFRAGLGGPLGNGRQWISWVALPDVTRAIEFALKTGRISGPVNITAPNPAVNLEFTRALAHVLHRPAFFRVPSLGLRLAFGEMAEATILGSQRVMPARLTAAGFDFEYPELDAALRAVLSPAKE